MGLFNRKKKMKIEQREVPGRPDLTAISEESLYEMAMSQVDVIAEEIQEGVPEHIATLLSVGTFSMFHDDLDKEGQTLAQSVARYGFVSRQVELQRMTATLYGDNADFLYSLYDNAEIPEGEPGCMKTIAAAVDTSPLPINSEIELDPEVAIAIPGWPTALREMIGGIFVRGLVLSAEENGQGASVPEDHKLLQAFCYGYMIHIWYELTPIDWLEGIDEFRR